MQQGFIHPRWQRGRLLLGQSSRLLLQLLLLMLLQLNVTETCQQWQQLSKQSFCACYSTPVSRLILLLLWWLLLLLLLLLLCRRWQHWWLPLLWQPRCWRQLQLLLLLLLLLLLPQLLLLLLLLFLLQLQHRWQHLQCQLWAPVGGWPRQPVIAAHLSQKV